MNYGDVTLKIRCSSNDPEHTQLDYALVGEPVTAALTVGYPWRCPVCGMLQLVRVAVAAAPVVGIFTKAIEKEPAPAEGGLSSPVSPAKLGNRGFRSGGRHRRGRGGGKEL